MQKLKNFVESIKALWIIRKHPSAFMLTSSIFDFVANANNQGRSLITKIAIVNAGKSDEPIDIELVHLWAGIGTDTPIKRLEQLRNKCNRYEELLLKYSNETITENEKQEVKLLLEIKDY